MQSDRIKEHWAEWARTHGRDIKATTRTWTAKALEIDALTRRLAALLPAGEPASVLEVGCGNGMNIVGLARTRPELSFVGVDYVAEMVTMARANADAGDVGERTRFHVGDVLQLASQPELAPSYDVVFTDRCIINLETTQKQALAIAQLAAKARPGGHVLMIENSQVSFAAQNACREALGLPARKAAEFNLFFDEAVLRPQLGGIGLDLVEVEDFGSLHDLVLYALVPASNGGAVDYAHPLVEAATKLSMSLAKTGNNTFGSLGQNRLFVCRKNSR